ncbi:MAG: succinylglutamate-semialdehyde dehydrogenase [Bdellovibrio sp.]
MRFVIKGNYYHGTFHLPKEDGKDNVISYIDRYCPGNLEDHLWSCPIDLKAVDHVIESAVSGFKFWKKINIEERINFLRKYQDNLKARKDEIARAISYEMGKPLWEAYTEANSLISKVDVTISDSLPRVRDIHIENIMPDTTGHVFYRPLGPALVIGPFNFPCHLANTQILSALITGNSVIFKPSEKTCYSAQILMECFHQATFPKGVVNMIHGVGETANRLTKSKEIKAVFFTGSKEVGLKILENTHMDLSKLVSLELGGKNPAIIHEDADIELALQEMIRGCYLTTGQRCTSTAVIFLHNKHLDYFVDNFHSLSKKVIVDHPVEFDQEPLMGPLVDQRALDTYLLFMGMAKREGIEEVMRGKQLEKKFKGYYVSPSIHLAKSWNTKSLFLMSEIFGPNCTIVPYSDIEETFSAINTIEYGLASCVFTKSQDIFNQCIQNIDSGLINLNRSTCGASPKLPFGGVKNSGNYRPAAVATIDACAYQMSSLEAINPKAGNIGDILGLKKD